MTPDLAVAVDVGGTRLKVAVVEIDTGTVVTALDPSETGSSWIDAAAGVERAVYELRQRHPAALALGLALPGVLDHGQVIHLPGKLEGVVGVDLGGWARELAGEAAVFAINDAVAAAVGEAWAGAGQGFARVVTLTLGTGVGVGVVEHGRPLGAGPYGAGILGGQIPIGGDGTDSAGARGSIEAGCRAGALVETAGRPEWKRARDVLHAAGAGEADALAAVDRYRNNLVRALVALAFAHGPEAIIVGGGVANDPLVLEGVGARVREAMTFGLSPQVVPAALGDQAALSGLGVLLGRRRALG